MNTRMELCIKLGVCLISDLVCLAFFCMIKLKRKKKRFFVSNSCLLLLMCMFRYWLNVLSGMINVLFMFNFYYFLKSL